VVFLSQVDEFAIKGMLEEWPFNMRRLSRHVSTGRGMEVG